MQVYWLRVSGADTSPFGTGRYGLIVNFGTGPSPVAAPANTTTADGIPITGIGGWPEKIAMGQADSQGFDSFGLKPEEIVHSVPQTSAAQGLHDRVPPALT